MHRRPTLRDSSKHPEIKFADTEFDDARHDRCPSCDTGLVKKYTTYSRSRNTTAPVANILHQVQMDMIDNRATPDRHSYEYALILVDVASRLFFVYGLKQKSDAFAALLKWRDHISSSVVVGANTTVMLHCVACDARYARNIS